MVADGPRAADASRRREALELEFVKLYGDAPSDWLRAPGRVDLMGSHTDYNDGFVATMSLDRDTWLALRPRSDRRVRIASLDLPGTAEFDLAGTGEFALAAVDHDPAGTAEFDLADTAEFDLAAVDHDPAAVEHDPAVPWTDYVRGAARVLLDEGATLEGFDGLLQSTIPFGSGLSSSAAIEIVALLAFDLVSGLLHEPVALARLGQRAENEFVGVSCGILDQYTSVMGEAGHALLLDCRALTSRPVAIAPGLAVVICDTRAPRQLTGSEYDERRAQCEAGAAHIGRSLPGAPGIRALRDVPLALFEAHEEEMDPVVARRCRFILEENERVLALADALPAGDPAALAALFDTSWAGANELFEIGAPAMSAMHAAMTAAPGLVARRQAGAGFGGCLVAIVERGSEEAFGEHVVRAYAAATGIEPSVFAVQAAPGAGPVEAHTTHPRG